MSVITAKQLTKRYGRRIGVEGLNLEVPEGAVFGFLGPNGAGKTTTIRVLVGLLKPTDGAASISGLDCWRDSAKIKAEVGYLPGDLRLYPWMTCNDGLRIFGRIRGCDLTLHGHELADLLCLDPGLPVRRMSRGMRQKLGLILALVHRPRLLILDEPTASLDPIMQERLYEYLRSLARAGHTIFFSSHTLSEVEHLCDRVAILREGKVVADEALDELRRRAKRMVTLRWGKSGAPSDISPPAFLEVYDRGDEVWQALLAGPAMELVRWCERLPLEDVSVSQADLASLFQQYYTGDGH